MVMKHFHEKKIEAQRAAKASEMHQKRITGFIAKMIKTFWSNVEKASTYHIINNFLFKCIFIVTFKFCVAACIQAIN
jgi:hypothetical protein